MSANNLNKFTPTELAFAGCLIMLGFLCISPAFLSIGMGIVVAAAIWQLVRERDFSRLIPDGMTMGLAGLFLVAFMVGIFSENKAGWSEDIRIKLPFFISFSFCIQDFT